MTLKDKIFADPFTENEDDLDTASEKLKQVKVQPPATRKELWSYYLYYNGDNGFTVNSYMPNILQYLASRGGFDPSTPKIKGCDANDATKPCNVYWLNTPNGIPVSAMSLYVQSIAFSVQFLLFTTFGSLADYGRWNRYILLAVTVIGCATQILPIVLVNDDGTHWATMMAIMIVGQISYGASLVFYAAAFPNLSDNLPVVRRARADDRLSTEETQTVIDKWRNHVSAISTTFSNIGFVMMAGILSGIAFLPWSNYVFPDGVSHTLGNVPLFSFIGTAVCGAFWVLNAVPYFIFQPSGRQGLPLPKGTNHFTVGWISIWNAFKEVRKLRYLFLYFVAYFMFSDAVSTVGQLQGIITNEITNFSALQITILNLATAVTSIIGCMLFLWLSKRFSISTKANLIIIIVLTAVVPLWGCFGIFFSNFGMKTMWELWFINVWSGLFTAPIWAWQQTMLAELTPKGKENLFFGLFGIVNKASSWIGPVVIGAIVQATGDNWKGWPFVLALFVVSGGILCFIDVKAAKQDLEAYAAADPTIPDVLQDDRQDDMSAEIKKESF